MFTSNFDLKALFYKQKPDKANATYRKAQGN